MQVIFVDFSKDKSKTLPLIGVKIAENIYCTDVPVRVLTVWFKKTKSLATKNTSILIMIPRKNEVSGWKYYIIGNKNRVNSFHENIYCIDRKIML